MQNTMKWKQKLLQMHENYDQLLLLQIWHEDEQILNLKNDYLKNLQKTILNGYIKNWINEADFC